MDEGVFLMSSLVQVLPYLGPYPTHKSCPTRRNAILWANAISRFANEVPPL